MIFGFPSKEAFKVAALESSIKLQEMSKILIDLFNLRNSAKLSQNIWPNELLERLRLSKLELLFNRSIQSFEPALSTRRFNLRLKCFKILLTLRAYAKYLEPS